MNPVVNDISCYANYNKYKRYAKYERYGRGTL